MLPRVKFNPTGPVVAGLLTAALLAGCSPAGKEKDAEPKEKSAESKEKSTEPESRVKRGTNGEVTITLDAATQKLMGLQVQVVPAAQLSPEVKAYGRVLDPSPLAVQVADLIAARAAGEASNAEARRLQTLAAQSNASQRALQAAEAAAAKDRAQLEANRLRLLATWGSAIAQRTNLEGFVQSLGSAAAVLVQLDLPAGEAMDSPPTGARLTTLSDASHPIPAQLIGPAPAVDPQFQGRGFLFLVEPNERHLAPGTSVTGLISREGEPQTGVALPRDAVVRFNGATWVYLQTAADVFQRTEVKLGSSLEQGWFVREALKPQDKVVNVGAQQLLSEELKGQLSE